MNYIEVLSYRILECKYRGYWNKIELDSEVFSAWLSLLLSP